MALAMLGAITYGVTHDQLTARASPEYFTIGHRPLLPTDDPTILALAWGIVATWWMGLGIGLPLATACRAGPWPPLGWRECVRPMLCALGLAAVSAAWTFLSLIGDAGPFGWPIPPEVPPQATGAYRAVWATHVESYTIGLLTMVALPLWAVVARSRRAGRAPGTGHMWVLAVLALAHPVVRIAMGGVYVASVPALELSFVAAGLCLGAWATARGWRNRRAALPSKRAEPGGPP